MKNDLLLCADNIIKLFGAIGTESQHMDFIIVSV